MPISAINTDPSFVNLVKYSTGNSSILKIGETAYKQNGNSFQKSISLDDKNTIVSEKLEKDQSADYYNLRLQNYAPASQVFETVKPYNDVQKFNSFKNKSDNSFNQTGRKKVDYYTQSDDSSIDNGFYMVVNDTGVNKTMQQLKDHIDLWRDKINKKYNSGFFKEPGSLVNSLA